MKRQRPVVSASPVFSRLVFSSPVSSGSVLPPRSSNALPIFRPYVTLTVDLVSRLWIRSDGKLNCDSRLLNGLFIIYLLPSRLFCPVALMAGETRGSRVFSNPPLGRIQRMGVESASLSIFPDGNSDNETAALIAPDFFVSSV